MSSYFIKLQYLTKRFCAFLTSKSQYFLFPLSSSRNLVPLDLLSKWNRWLQNHKYPNMNA
ncbi:hypothetical protein CW304_22045 [Bacillus sp. UFRGS-B20]|nr:hypothetical protein CW304_22045 [Bacillus sp. UFRGS-B20]